MIDLFTEREGDDIILDFFAGSGTTGHAILNLNEEDGGARQYILCEQMDYADNVTAERVKKVIKKNKQGEFVYCELMQWNEEFVQQIQKARIKKELSGIWEKMKEKAHISYLLDIEAFDENAEEFEQLTLEQQKAFLLETLDKNQLYVNYSEIDDEDYNVSTEDKELNRHFYKG